MGTLFSQQQELKIETFHLHLSWLRWYGIRSPRVETWIHENVKRDRGRLSESVSSAIYVWLPRRTANLLSPHSWPYTSLNAFTLRSFMNLPFFVGAVAIERRKKAGKLAERVFNGNQ